MEEGGGWLYLMGLKRVTIFSSENFLMTIKVDWQGWRNELKSSGSNISILKN